MPRPDLICRICLAGDATYPCGCRGSLAVHQECLEKWIVASGRKTCEICGHPVVSVWEDLRRVKGDMPEAMQRYLVWLTIFTLACPPGARTCVVVLQLILCANFVEGDGNFLVCQLFTCQWRLILPAACLRLACTALRRSSILARGGPRAAGRAFRATRGIRD